MSTHCVLHTYAFDFVAEDDIGRLRQGYWLGTSHIYIYISDLAVDSVPKVNTSTTETD